MSLNFGAYFFFILILNWKNPYNMRVNLTYAAGIEERFNFLVYFLNSMTYLLQWPTLLNYSWYQPITIYIHVYSKLQLHIFPWKLHSLIRLSYVSQEALLFKYIYPYNCFKLSIKHVSLHTVFQKSQHLQRLHYVIFIFSELLC